MTVEARSHSLSLADVEEWLVVLLSSPGQNVDTTVVEFGSGFDLWVPASRTYQGLANPIRLGHDTKAVGQSFGYEDVNVEGAGSGHEDGPLCSDD